MTNKMKELLKELQEREFNLLVKRSDLRFWNFVKAIQLDSKIENTQSVIKLVKLYTEKNKSYD